MVKLNDALREKWFWLCGAGLAACLVLFGEGTAFSRHGMPVTFSVVTTADALSGGWAIMGAFLAMALLSGQASRACRSRTWLGTAAGLSAVGTFLLLAGEVGLPVGGAAQLVGGVLLALGSTGMLMSWGDLVIPLGARASSGVLSCAFALTVLFDLLAYGLNTPAELVALVCLCGASPTLLVRAQAPLAQRKDGGADSLEVRGVVPAWVSFATLALFGSIAGLIQSGVIPQLTGLMEGGLSSEADPTGLSVDLGVLLAAGAVGAGGRLMRGNNMAFYRWTVMALLAVIAYLSAILPPSAREVATSLMTMARMLMFAYVWALFSTPARSVSPVRLFSTGWLLFLVPNSAATRIGLLACANEAATLAACVGVAVLLAALFAAEFTAGALRGGYLVADENAAERDSAESLARRSQALAQQGGLTPREAEVLSLLLQGRSRAFIADTLLISGETVRTHTQHVYQKLDVHSREELCALVER